MIDIIGKIVGKVLYRHQLPCYKLCAEPLVLVSYWQDFYKQANDIIRISKLSQKPVYFLFQLGWHRETEERAEELKTLLTDIVKQQALEGQYHFVFLANSEKEEALIRACGLQCHYIHQNAFLDENNYSIMPDVRKDYDAVYLARITPFKRHHLAAQVKRLKLIGAYHDYEKDYAENILKTVPYASWTKKVFASHVAQHLNQAKVGLCLSREEGAMFVSAEYLLCGLPIVSTVNIGGRDGLFEPDFVTMVEDTPEAVAAAVDEIILQKIAPAFIRQKTIENMLEHRQKLITLVQSIYDENKIKKDFASEWPGAFYHKLGLRSSVPLRIQKDRILR